MPDILNNNYVKFLRGTPDAYKNCSKDKDTLYFITTPGSLVGKLYLGETLIAGSITGDENIPEGVIDSLSELLDVDLTEKAEGKVLGYDGNKWVPMNLPEAFEASIMTGADENNAGTAGYVPAPQAGDEGKFLRGDGTWATIETSSTTQIFETEVEAGAEHVTAIEAKVGEATLQNGDIAIVKEAIANGKKQYTAYVYDGDWKAMDGNYSAANVYTNEDITVTTAVGELPVDEVIGAGTNMSDLLVKMLSQSKDPEITKNPSVSITVTNNGGTSFEAGTSIVTKWNSTFDAGSYTYKSTASKDTIVPVAETGVTPISWSIKLSGTEIGTTANGTAEGMILGDSSLTYTTSVTYSDGNYALTNLNKLPETDVQIKGTTITSTGATISSYRKMYAGAIDKDATVDNATIRSLLNTSGKKASTSSYEFTAKTGDEKLIFAYPKSLTTKTPKFEYFTMSWEGFDGFEVAENTVKVADVRGGENGLADYIIYTYVPAGAFRADTSFRVSF